MSTPSSRPSAPATDLLRGVGLSPAIRNLNQEEFIGETIIKVRDYVWVANGYALSNIIFIEATSGVLVVDSTETKSSAKKALKDWRRESGVTKPIKAIIFTHHHSDHTPGSPALVEDPAHPPEVWAHATLPGEEDQYYIALGAAGPRSLNQFGVKLPPEVHTGCAIGPHLKVGSLGRLPVTNEVTEKRHKTVIAGLHVELLHAPGETDDQMMVWIPEYDLLCPGDNFYRSFPNIYAIRGVVARDARKWSDAVDLIRSLRPGYLAGSHHRPLVGAAYIYDLLTKYRDGIRYMHDQTLRWMNRGLAPDDIVRQVSLPQGLAECSWLGETYGTLEWSVKAVFDRYLGWFSGRVEELRPLGRAERAERVLGVVEGGAKGTVTKARAALNSGDTKWALELATYVFCLGPEHTLTNQEVWNEAKDIRIEATKALASVETSANGRNYFLSSALEDAGLAQRHISLWWYNRVLHATNIYEVLELLAIRVRAESVAGVHKKISLTIQDTGQIITAQLRNSILESTPCATSPSAADATYDVIARAPLATWKSIIIQDMTSEDAANKKCLIFARGRSADLDGFLKCFDDAYEEPVSKL